MRCISSDSDPPEDMASESMAFARLGSLLGYKSLSFLR